MEVRQKFNPHMVCGNCHLWEKPSCGWGFGNCRHIKGKGMSKDTDKCSQFDKKENG